MKNRSLVIGGLMLAAIVNVFAQQTEGEQQVTPPVVEASPVPLPSPAENSSKRSRSDSPPLKNLRYDEDFSHLRDESRRTNALDRQNSAR